MNKEITMIELLNNLCNGMKIKGKFKTSDGTVFNDIESLLDHEGLMDYDHDLSMVIENLNDKVEIIEENKKIEKLSRYKWEHDGVTIQEMVSIDAVFDKVNELIDVVNELKKEVKHDWRTDHKNFN